MLLDRNTFFVKEKVQFMKLSNTHDIFDPETNKKIGVAREEQSGFKKFLKLFLGSAAVPTKVSLYCEESNSKVLEIYKHFTWFRAKVSVRDAKGNDIGYFQGKLKLSLGIEFNIFNAVDINMGILKGNWKARDFKITNLNGSLLGSITKKWFGIGKEFFTDADNYVIDISNNIEENKVKLLVLGACLALDSVVFEAK